MSSRISFQVTNIAAISKPCLIMHGGNSVKRYECHSGIHLLRAAGRQNTRTHLILVDQ